jgi:DNA-binding XRE family transcriptional regulator
MVAMSSAASTSFGDYIREQRKLSKLSLREMSRLTNVSNAYLSQIERGLHAPSLRIMQAVAKALDVPVDELVNLMPGPARLANEDASNHSDVETAIRQEKRLTADQKAALITVFHSYLQAGPDTPAAE